MIALLLALAAPAHAWTDENTYPGSICQPQTYAYAAHLDISNGAITNSGTSGLYVTCPIENDNNDDMDVLVYVVDNSTSDKITCTLYSRALSSASSRDSESDSTTTTFTGGDSLALAAGYGTVSSYYQYLYCYIPAKTSTGSSGIYGIYVYE